jgi:hypothetical protein
MGILRQMPDNFKLTATHKITPPKAGACGIQALGQLAESPIRWCKILAASFNWPVLRGLLPP